MEHGISTPYFVPPPPPRMHALMDKQGTLKINVNTKATFKTMTRRDTRGYRGVSAVCAHVRRHSHQQPTINQVLGTAVY